MGKTNKPKKKNTRNDDPLLTKKEIKLCPG